MVASAPNNSNQAADYGSASRAHRARLASYAQLLPAADDAPLVFAGLRVAPRLRRGPREQEPTTPRSLHVAFFRSAAAASGRRLEATASQPEAPTRPQTGHAAGECQMPPTGEPCPVAWIVDRKGNIAVCAGWECSIVEDQC